MIETRRASCFAREPALVYVHIELVIKYNFFCSSFLESMLGYGFPLHLAFYMFDLRTVCRINLTVNLTLDAGISICFVQFVSQGTASEEEDMSTS